MNWEINITKNGKHFFATHERSINNEDNLNAMLAVFKEKFPEAEGYKILIYKTARISELIYP